MGVSQSRISLQVKEDKTHLRVYTATQRKEKEVAVKKICVCALPNLFKTFLM